MLVFKGFLQFLNVSEGFASCLRFSFSFLMFKGFCKVEKEILQWFLDVLRGLAKGFDFFLIFMFLVSWLLMYYDYSSKVAPWFVRVSRVDLELSWMSRSLGIIAKEKPSTFKHDVTTKKNIPGLIGGLVWV